MNIAGQWKISGNTVAGRQEGVLSFEVVNDNLIGTYKSSMGKADLKDITIEGSNIRWKASVKFPLPMSVEFRGTILDDDHISGAVNAGVFGKIQLEAVRMPESTAT